MHPFAGLLDRVDATLAEPVELIKAGKLYLELQRRAALAGVGGTRNRALYLGTFGFVVSRQRPLGRPATPARNNSVSGTRLKAATAI